MGKYFKILKENFLTLKETYYLSDKKLFNNEFAAVKGLGRNTKKALLRGWGSD